MSDDGREEECPDNNNGAGTDEVAKKKKKKNNNKKRKPGCDGLAEVDNSVFRRLGSWPANSIVQSWPPTRQVCPSMFRMKNGNFPAGEFQPHAGEKAQAIAETAEAKEREALHTDKYSAFRQAAEVHRQVRRYVQSIARPGMKLIDICQSTERKTEELVVAHGLERGKGFPTGCSLNHVAAHYTPNYGDETVLSQGDTCKMDFGVQVGGHIIDCAWTMAFDEKFDNIIQSTIDATNAGIKEAGADARFYEISTAIEETIKSYEMEVDGKTVPILPIRNLNGHSIGLYEIHGGKSVPMVAIDQTTRMEEGETYAIETFASTGRGKVVEDGECSHYMKTFDVNASHVKLKSAREVLSTIEREFGTLAFCRRWLDDAGCTRHLMGLKSLVDNEIITPYPPLVDTKGSFTSQMEHTILIKPTGMEVVSRGMDF